LTPRPTGTAGGRIRRRSPLIARLQEGGTWPGNIGSTRLNIWVFLGTVIPLVVISIAINVNNHTEFGGPTTGKFYWERLLGFHGAPVAQDRDKVVFVWWGRDSHVYFTVSKEDVARSFPQAVIARIDQLVSWLRHDPARSGDLQALTGQHFGDDAKAWESWWLANRETFVCSPSAYENLKAARFAPNWRRMPRSSIAEWRFYDARLVYEQDLAERRLNSRIIACPVIAGAGAQLLIWNRRRRLSLPNATRGML
jgi:hypothetical protein